MASGRPVIASPIAEAGPDDAHEAGPRCVRFQLPIGKPAPRDRRSRPLGLADRRPAHTAACGAPRNVPEQTMPWRGRDETRMRAGKRRMARRVEQ